MRQFPAFLLILFATCGASLKSTAQKIDTISILDFGAKPNDKRSDQLAFESISRFVNARGGFVVIKIPKGTYIVGRQEAKENSSYYLTGKTVLDLRNCQKVSIEGEPGARLLFDVGMRFGTFSPKTGKSTNKTFECVSKNNVGTERAMLGKVISVHECNGISISNIEVDGNFYKETVNNMNNFELRGIKRNTRFQNGKINLGGGYGDCGIQIEHYGVFIFHSSNVHLSNVVSKRFGTDGLMIANVAKQNINVIIENCVFDYNSRTGIAIGGGQDIIIKNSTISNTGRFLYISTATGIDIEPEGDNLVKNKTVQNVLISNCNIFGNSEGAILAKFGGNSYDVQIIDNNISSSRTAVVVGAKSQRFVYKNNKIDGEVIVNGKNLGLLPVTKNLIFNE